VTVLIRRSCECRLLTLGRQGFPVRSVFEIVPTVDGLHDLEFCKGSTADCVLFCTDPVKDCALFGMCQTDVVTRGRTQFISW
jgi:hypothetical protein